MAEGGTTSAGAGGDSSSATPRVTSSFVKIGDRTRFTVELRPAETTIVSWKKLMKDAARAEGRGTSSAPVTAPAAPASVAAAAAVAAVPDVPAASHSALEARLSPGKPASNEDEPAPNRFSAVIEKIERLYMGKDSSDEEDLADIPDDDQYDTEDSFIDDAELDEYFEVDKSKTKHDGYFVNRGQLEKVEPPEIASQQPKKRRRKDMVKTAADNDDGQRPSKHMKAGKKAAEKAALLAEKGMLSKSEGTAVKSSEEMKFQNHQKVAPDGKSSLDPSPSLRTSNADASLSIAECNDNHKTGLLPAKNPSGKLKEASDKSDTIELLHKTYSVRNHIDESQLSVQQKDNSGMREKIDLNLPDNKHTMQPVKNSVVHKKEGSSVKPKANVLEKAIRELEKMVAESRPPAPDAQDGDSSSQIKRRLPREIKHKLGKVARLAHASNGKVSNELLSRLMGILGHIIQMRTLKRHLKIMLNVSLSAKQEKDDKFQQTKREVTDMIKARVPSLMSKAAEHRIGGSGELPESAQSEKATKGQLCMDDTLEDKICDLYDIFVDGLDEDAAPQVRKLYAELAELWPKGVMDNHGIKHAICRAKERKRTLNEKNKELEKVRRKKVIATNTEDIARIESNSAAQLQFVDVRLATDPNVAVVCQQNRLSGTPSSAAATVVTPMNIAPPAFTSSTNVPSFERLKHEKVKGSHSSSLNDGKMVDGVSVKKKVKKRAQSLPGEAQLRTEKLSSHQADDRQKHKVVGVPAQSAPQKSKYEEFRFEPLT